MNRAVCFFTLVSLAVAVSLATDDALPPPSPLPRLPRPSNNGSAAPQPPLMPPPRRPNQTQPSGSADVGSHSHCDEDSHSGSGRSQPGGNNGANNGAAHGGSMSGPVNIYVPQTTGRTGIIVGCAIAATVVATVIGVLLVRRAAAARNAATAFSPESDNGNGFFATLKKKRMTIRAASRKDRVKSVASADAVKCASEPHDAADDLVSMSSVSVAADCAVVGTVVVTVDVAAAASAAAAAEATPVLPIAMTPNAFAAAHSPFAVPVAAAADAATPTATLERRRSSSSSGHRLFAVLGHRVE